MYNCRSRVLNYSRDYIIAPRAIKHHPNAIKGSCLRAYQVDPTPKTPVIINQRYAVCIQYKCGRKEDEQSVCGCTMRLTEVVAVDMERCRFLSFTLNAE
jgi:hypothetical protein